MLTEYAGIEVQALGMRCSNICALRARSGEALNVQDISAQIHWEVGASPFQSIWDNPKVMEESFLSAYNLELLKSGLIIALIKNNNSGSQ
jgi:hypothetical protein